MHTGRIWRNFNVGPIHYSTCNVSGSWHWWWACKKMFHVISREFRQRFHRWEWQMMTMGLHDERWCKCWWSQRLCGHAIHPWALKPSHIMKALSSLTMSNFNAYKKNLKEFQRFPIHYSTCGIGGSWHWWWACWKTFHDISIEFRPTFHRWEWQMMTMRLHDERWCKQGWSQRLYRHVRHR